ncbi:TolC family protein [Oceanicaulis alexandrii]|uniref:TolC family protein n=1 Tax=Oceanicaulis alexandrii TaxID=153233 RepID=UPI0023521433|nr:TolC family protein [Oceanicaulis alexandrii]
MSYAFPALLLVGALFLSPPAQAQSAEEHVRIALEAAPSVAVARAEREIALARAEQRDIGEYETSLDAGFARRQAESSSDTSEWQVGVTRSFRWPQKRRLDNELARTEIAMANVSYAAAWQAEALEWVNLWVQWDQARALEAIMASRLEDARARRDAEAIRVNQNRGRGVDLDRLERDLSLAAAALQGAQTDQELTRLALEARFPGTARPELGQGLLPETCTLSQDTEDALSAMLAENPQLRVARLELNHADLMRQRAEYDRRADIQLGLQVFSEQDGRETGVGVGVSLPITGGLRAARLTEAASAQGGRVASLAAAEATIRRQALELIARTIRSERQVEQTREAVTAAERVLARLERGRDLEAVTVLDILEARSALWGAREAEIAASSDRLKTQLQTAIRLGCVLGVDG